MKFPQCHSRPTEVDSIGDAIKAAELLGWRAGTDELARITRRGHGGAGARRQAVGSTSR